MKKRHIILLAALILFCTFPADSAFASMKIHSSDMVGVLLEHPSDWIARDFNWGYSITEPGTNSSVTVQVYFMPAELEAAYDVNMDKEFEKIYGNFFKSEKEEEVEINGVIWDYTLSKGSIGLPTEYYEESYSTLIGNSVYSFQLYYESAAKDKLKSEFAKIVDSVRLMYRESELPLIREYKKEWDIAKEKNQNLVFDNPAGDVSFEYPTPWMFAGTGVSTMVAFHYIAGDPFHDVDMLMIKIDNPDIIVSTKMIEGILASMTCPYSSETEDRATFNGREFYLKSVTQGQGEDVLHTRFYATKHNNSSYLAIFAYHEMAKQDAPTYIESLLNGLKLN